MHDIVTNMLISDTQNWTKTRYLRLHFMGKTIWWVMGWAKTFRFFPIFLYGYVVLPVNVAAGHTIGPVQAHGFRLTALLVLIEQWISHSLITSSALDNIWQSTCHTPVVERKFRFLFSNTRTSSPFLIRWEGAKYCRLDKLMTAWQETGERM